MLTQFSGLDRNGLYYSAETLCLQLQIAINTVSVLGREEGYTVKYTPLPEGVPKGEARGNS